MFYGAPAPSLGTFNVKDACTGATAFSYTNTLVNPPLMPDTQPITDTAVTIRNFSDILGSSEGWGAGSFYATFPGILTPQKGGIFATSTGRGDAFYTWKDDDVYSFGTGNIYLISNFFPVGSK